MKISVFGIGYVGCVSLGCLAQDGHTLVGVDISKDKIDLINSGNPTIVEDAIAELIDTYTKNGTIKATTDHEEAVLNTDVSIVCVGTPSTEQGHLDLKHVHNVARQIGRGLRLKESFHSIVIRSTVPPGTNRMIGEIVEKESGKKKNIDFGIVSNPEFMREGSAVQDYYHPSMTVIGSECQHAINIVKQLYYNINAPFIVTDIEVAEIIKYVNNSFHALKIAFANEVGNICKKLRIDAHKVMDIFCRDEKLNISPSYFKPGFAYGGSCLPKDLLALGTFAHDHYLISPVIEGISKSNENQIEIAYKIVEGKRRNKVGIIGLSFKPGTDDLRYSPTVELTEKLIGKGYQITIYDPNVYNSKLTGTNKLYIEQHIPHLIDLITDDISKVVRESELIVVSHDYQALHNLLREYPEKFVVDLVRINNDSAHQNYEGICW